VDHRDDLLKTRTQTVNRLHVVLTNLVAGGAGHDLTANQAAELLHGVRPRDAASKMLHALAVELISEVRHLDRRIIKAVSDIEVAVTASGTTLTELHGIGALTAGKIHHPLYHDDWCAKKERHLHSTPRRFAWAGIRSTERTGLSTAPCRGARDLWARLPAVL
jgi:transposase